MERSYLLFDDYSHCVCMNETSESKWQHGMAHREEDMAVEEEKQFKFHKNVKGITFAMEIVIKNETTIIVMDVMDE